MELTQSEIDTEFTDREKSGTYEGADVISVTLTGDTAEVSGVGAVSDGSTVTIERAGTYVISGTLTDGQILVNAAKTDKVQIVLNGAQINCETSAAIYVRQADKVFLTLAEGSRNNLSGGTEYVDTDDNTVDAVVFSKEDLAVNGAGSLEVEANYKHGIISKDDLVINGGDITVNAAAQCLGAKDNVRIWDGTFHLTTDGKAVKAENTEETTRGNIYVAGGTFTIQSGDDAFHASGSVIAAGGTFEISTGDDAFHADVDMVVNDGQILITGCYEGLEGHRVVINGGTIDITASDDAINAADPDSSSEASDTPWGGGKMPADGEKPEMPEGMEMPADGEKPEMPEGMEVPADGEKPEMPGGEERPQMNDGRGWPGGDSKGAMGPGGGMDNDSDAYIKITGGTLAINAEGDGIDSNGSLWISGGTVYVDGPTSGGDGALDYNGEGIITGGTVIAAGSSAMAQGFGEESTQCSVLKYLDSTLAAGSEVVLNDAEGKELLRWKPAKEYSSVVISCPEMSQGETYNLTLGDEVSELTLETVVTTDGDTGMGGKMGGMHAGRGSGQDKEGAKDNASS